MTYKPGHDSEEEVILKPGTKLEICETDMIPSTEDCVPRLLVPVTKDFFRYGSIAVTLGYPTERLFQFHELKNKYSSADLTNFFKTFKAAKADGRYINLSRSNAFINDLSKLTGLPLNHLELSETKIKKVFSYKF